VVPQNRGEALTHSPRQPDPDEPDFNKKAAVSGGFLIKPAHVDETLFQLGRNAVELRVQGGADRIDRRNNYNGNASGDETVLDRGRTRLVLQERKNLRHLTHSIWL
jgi:hypothetical protein